MPSQRRRLLAFVLVFICVASHRCFAGPINHFCEQRQFSVLNPFASPASRSAPSSQSANAVLQLDRFSLTHIVVPPEFRARDSKTKHRTEDILQTPVWPPSPPPCKAVLYGTSI